MEKKRFTPNQLKAITALLEATSVEVAAKKVGISRSTLFAWLKLEHFKNKLEEERRALFNEGMASLKSATKAAANRLIELLDSKDENVRRLTAKEVINVALKITEVQDLEERIAKLEEILAAKHEPI